MNLQTLIREATDEELVVITAILQRANTKKAVVVTMKIGDKTRRYVVSQEDEHLFRGIKDGPITESGYEHPLFRLDFGGRWLRRLGRVDEMYGSLSGEQVVKVARIDRAKVWGNGCGCSESCTIH